MTASIDPDYEYHEFYLDSSDATTPFDSNISKLNWPMFNLNTTLKNVASIKVLEAQIPMSYCVTAGAQIAIKMWNADKTSSKTVTIALQTTGAPSGAQIASYISSQLALAGNLPTGLTGWDDGGHLEYLICTFIPSSSSTTGLPYFSLDCNDHSYGNALQSNQDFEIIISDQRSEDVLGWAIGSTRCINYGVVGSGGTQPSKYSRSSNPALITGSPYIYISSNAVGNLCKTYLPQGAALLSGGVSSPQVAKVSVSQAVQGQWLLYADYNTNWFDVDNIATISQMDFYCQLGNYGGYIDFQGLPFSLKLGVLLKRDNKVSNSSRSTLVQTLPFYYNK